MTQIVTVITQAMRWVWGLGVLADHDRERECLTEQKRRKTPISSVVGAKERHALPVVLSGADKT
jgi:hypothetical protein